MNHRDQSLPKKTISHRASRLIKGSVAAISVVMLSFAGMSYANEGFMPHHGGHMMEMRHAPDEAMMAKHLERMLDHMVPDITDAQKASIKAIAQAAGTDMKAFHEQKKALRLAEMNILSAATIDRNALEQNRVESMRLAEQMSKRKNQALADAADVLSAEQRAKIAEKMKARMEKRMVSGATKSPFGK